MSAPAQATDYQGWKNYETYTIKLYIDNEREQHEYWAKQTAFLMSEQGYEV